MIKKLLLSFLVVTFFVTFGILFFLNKEQKQSLTISIEPSNIPANVTSVNYEMNNQNAKSYPISDGQTIKLPKGDYIITTEETSETKAFSHTITLGDSPLAYTVSHSFSESKLNTLLKSESSGAMSAIRSKYGPELQLFNIGSFRLYDRGQWMSAVALPKNSTIVDTYRIVLKKEGDGWTIITTPPEIVISATKYPDIPKDILYEINSKY